MSVSPKKKGLYCFMCDIEGKHHSGRCPIFNTLDKKRRKLAELGRCLRCAGKTDSSHGTYCYIRKPCSRHEAEVVYAHVGWLCEDTAQPPHCY